MFGGTNSQVYNVYSNWEKNGNNVSIQDLIKNEICQIKNDIDQFLMVFAQIFTIAVTFGSICRAVFGPLPYFAVVIIIEVCKLAFTVNMGILNTSHLVQILIIFDFR